MNLIKKVNLDISRFIASLMVVAIHIYPLSFISPNLDYVFTRIIFRIAVPIFLMITGYYLLPKALINQDNLKTYTLKILKLYLISTILYLPLNIYKYYLAPFNLLVFLKDFFINGSFYHLWYFPALILGLWLTYYLLKKLPFNTVIPIVIILYIIGLFGDNYYGLIENIPFLKNFYHVIFSVFDYTRNGLFYTPIFLLIGYEFSKKPPVLKPLKSSVLILIFLLTLIAEGLLLSHFNIPRHTSMYLSLLPLAYFTFSFLLSKNLTRNKTLSSLATWIYILHPFFIVIVRIISRLLHLKILVNHSLVNYLVVLMLTIGFILSIQKIKEVVKNGRKSLKKSCMG